MIIKLVNQKRLEGKKVLLAPSAEKLEVPKEQTFLGKFPENGSAILLIEI